MVTPIRITQGASNTSTLSVPGWGFVTPPSGTVMLIFIRSQYQGPIAPVPPPGWQRIAVAHEGSAGRTQGVYARTTTAFQSETPNYVFEMAGAPSRNLGVMVAFEAGEVRPVVTGFNMDYRGADSGQRLTPFDVDSPSLVFMFGGSEHVDGGSSAPNPPPEHFEEMLNRQTGTGTVSSRTSMWVGVREQGPGMTPEDTYNIVNSFGPAVQGFGIELLNWTPPPEGPLYNGAGQPVSVFEVTEQGPVERNLISIMRPGFDSVAHLVTTPGFTIASRGLVTFPEQSLYAYTRAVEHGHGALEFCIHRTSDGVFVGSFDSTLNRVTGSSGLPAISQMTWAQVQALQITIGQDAPRPIMRVEELLETYGQSHLLVFDLRGISFGINESDFLFLISDHPKERIIFRSEMSKTEHSLRMIQNGYNTMGYAESADAPNLQRWADSWTFLGMNYAASVTIWNNLLSLNKPVIAHTVSTQAQYNQAMSRGALGVMASGYLVPAVSWWNT